MRAIEKTLPYSVVSSHDEYCRRISGAVQQPKHHFSCRPSTTQCCALNGALFGLYAILILSLTCVKDINKASMSRTGVEVASLVLYIHLTVLQIVIQLPALIQK